MRLCNDHTPGMVTNGVDYHIIHEEGYFSYTGKVDEGKKYLEVSKVLG